GDARGAALDFAAAQAEAVTDEERAAAAYWRGRAASAAGDAAMADLFFRRAAEAWPRTFHGGLAAARAGVAIAVAPRQKARADDAPLAAVRVLYRFDRRDFALQLLADLARDVTRPSRVAAAAALAREALDPHAEYVVGEIASRLGLPMAAAAYPLDGLPAFDPLPGSAPPAVTLAIARQESAFVARAASGAGAHGLMQMILPTARATAAAAREPFDLARFFADPAYNARLGAAHLGSLIAGYRGDYALTFAAYNAGPGAVARWIALHGDPRDPRVDPVDWIEQIPYAETRDYVERTFANFETYRARLGERAPDLAADRGLPRAPSR
ncbi:MAG: lytic transglycosylase domain-containing protein, partial [Hyphomicrobiales bacterium]|nr:lytic transglycosylase domain-containing protein [Hyphomicrobiales bacterium]